MSDIHVHLHTHYVLFTLHMSDIRTNFASLGVGSKKVDDLDPGDEDLLLYTHLHKLWGLLVNGGVAEGRGRGGREREGTRGRVYNVRKEHTEEEEMEEERGREGGEEN